MEKPQKNNIAKENKLYNALKWPLLIVSVVIIIYFIVYIVLSLRNVSDIQALDVSLKVGDYVGFNLDQETLNFGTVLPGGGSSRIVTLKSGNPLRVHITFEGDTAKWMNVSKNDFILNGTEGITFFINTPADLNMGNYTGKAIILFTKL